MESKRLTEGVLATLLETSVEVGSMVSMDYEQAIIVSDDWHVREAGGLPKRCFLLAAPATDNEEAPEELILLAVKTVQPLQATRDLQYLKEELAARGAAPDTATRAKLQTIGYACSIVGSFYEHEGKLRFGADVERVLGHASYSILKPRGKSLGIIASYSRTPSEDPKAKLPVGVVRYTETQLAPDHEAVVEVDVRDFIGKKTAVLGMTRTGKSNTIKVLVEQVFRYSMGQKKRVGQLIFDPQGEYANANVQDKGALSNLGNAHDVAIYKTTAVSESGTREKPLLFNFFDESNHELVWELMLSELLSGVSGTSNYIAPLLNISLAKPERSAPIQEKVRYERRRLGFYALMSMARMEGAIKNFYLTLDKDLVLRLTADEAITSQASTSNASQLKVTTLEEAKEILEKLLEWYEHESLGNESLTKSFKDGDLSAFRDQVEAYRVGRRGVTSAFMRIKELHSEKSSGDVREEVWEDLSKGKLVIVDLSRGSSASTRAISEMIVNRLVSKASDRFTAGLPMIPFQLVVEEAHNLFERGGNQDDRLNPWVRLSKEASKYEIGLLYATQEPSSVDTRILSNTSNWVISHLNSKKETGELANYYSFSEWAEHLRATETKGFVRLKTESSPFIVPVQMAMFNPTWDHLDVKE